jgi:hypothetical protein
MPALRPCGRAPGQAKLKKVRSNRGINSIAGVWDGVFRPNPAFIRGWNSPLSGAERALAEMELKP